MSPRAHTRDRVTPLLLELARACRAASFYAPGHGALRDAVARAATIWTEALRGGPDLELELRTDRLLLDGGEAIEVGGLEELLRLFARRGVYRLRFCADLEPAELSALVRALCGSGRVEAALENEAVRRIRVAGPAAGTVRAEIDGKGDEGAYGESRVQPLSPGDLTRRLEELGETPDPADYEERAMSLLADGAHCAAAGDLAEAYAAALTLARHSVESQTRPKAIRLSARKALRELMDSDDLLEFVLESTSSDSVEGSIKATEVLLASGATVVPRLLARHARGETEVRTRISAVLIAMGDGAFPVLVDELASRDSARVRRAARLLGDMQHPRGVEFLLAHLADSDPYVKKEVGMALTRIGSERALGALIEALRGDDATAQIVAACLGNSRAESVVRALVAMLEPARGRSIELRREAIRGLGRIGRSEAAPDLARVLQRRTLLGRKGNRMLRIAAAHALGRIGGPDAFGYLDEQSHSRDAAVRQACNEALRMLLATPAPAGAR